MYSVVEYNYPIQELYCFQCYNESPEDVTPQPICQITNLFLVESVLLDTILQSRSFETEINIPRRCLLSLYKDFGL